MMQVTLICNCGLLISCGESTVLIDAPNTSYKSFRVMDNESNIRFQTTQEEFSNLRGLLFTHTHPDHCSIPAAREFVRMHPRCRLFLPDYDTSDNGVLTFGEIQVEYGYLPHMKVAEGMTKHYVLVISGGGRTLYVTADGETEPRLHADFLRGRKVDAVFWNPYYLAFPEMRGWMQELAAHKNYIYHIPDDPHDESGIRRKAERLAAQYGDTLCNCKLLYQYPSTELMW